MFFLKSQSAHRSLPEAHSSAHRLGGLLGRPRPPLVFPTHASHGGLQPILLPPWRLPHPPPFWGPNSSSWSLGWGPKVTSSKGSLPDPDTSATSPLELWAYLLPT